MEDVFETVVLGGKEQEGDAGPAGGEKDQEGYAEPDDDKEKPDLGPDEDPESDKGDGDADESKEDEDYEEGKEGKKEELTPEERRINAALRRQQERVRQQMAVEAEKKAAQARVDKAYADAYAGQVNPYSNKPILSEADYLAYRQDYEKDRVSLEMKKAGLSVEAINSIVDNHPMVKQAQEVIRQAEQTTAAARKAQAQEGITNELKVISALNPSIKTVDDLATMENADKYFDLVNRGGLSLSEAFKLVNFDSLTSRKTAAAKQAAVNQIAGKGHLTATASRGGGSVTVPAETMDMYRELFPDMKDADFQKHYAAHNKQPG